MIQSLTITDWRPTMNPNGGHGHFRTQHKRHEVDSGMAFLSARQAGWKFVPGKVRLTITLVYGKRPLPDHDNAVARCKGIIDGLKLHTTPWLKARPDFAWLARPIGFFTDDSPQFMDPPVVEAVVERGRKEVRITMEEIA